MPYENPYQNMIYGSFTVASLTAAYPPDMPLAGRYAYCTDRPGSAGMMVCDGFSWSPEDNDLIMAPTVRTVVLGQAYQATDPTQCAIITINLSANSSNSLLSTTQASQKAELLIAATAAGVTGGTGTKLATYENTQGGVLVVGLTITQTVNQQLMAALPVGWYFGVRQTVGANASVVSAYEQAFG